MTEKKKINFAEIVSNVILALALVVMTVYVISILSLVVFGLMNSVKDPLQFSDATLGFPKEPILDWEWKNYTVAFEALQAPYGNTGLTVLFPEQLFNSVMYAVGCAFFATFIPCITAYACAKFPYKSSKLIYTLVIIVMGLPVVGSLPSEIVMAQKLGLYDHIWGTWLMKANFLGTYFIVFHATFETLPNDFSEAAKIDGANHFNILFQIILPMVRNTFFVIMLLKFIEFWNDYQTVMIYLPKHPTAAYGVVYATMTTKYDSPMIWPTMRITGAMILLLPVLTVFLSFHSRIIGNVSMGGIKE